MLFKEALANLPCTENSTGGCYEAVIYIYRRSIDYLLLKRVKRVTY